MRLRSKAPSRASSRDRQLGALLDRRRRVDADEDADRVDRQVLLGAGQEAAGLEIERLLRDQRVRAGRDGRQVVGVRPLGHSRPPRLRALQQLLIADVGPDADGPENHPLARVAQRVAADARRRDAADDRRDPGHPRDRSAQRDSRVAAGRELGQDGHGAGPDDDRPRGAFAVAHRPREPVDDQLGGGAGESSEDRRRRRDEHLVAPAATHQRWPEGQREAQRPDQQAAVPALQRASAGPPNGPFRQTRYPVGHP